MSWSEGVNITKRTKRCAAYWFRLWVLFAFFALVTRHKPLVTGRRGDQGMPIGDPIDEKILE